MYLGDMKQSRRAIRNVFREVGETLYRANHSRNGAAKAIHYTSKLAYVASKKLDALR
jgi:hypothetical protein